MWLWTKALALFRHRPTNLARNRTVAAQDLGAAVIDVEAIDSEGCHGKRAGLPAARSCAGAIWPMYHEFSAAFRVLLAA
jgi:hypothetical protein